MDSMVETPLEWGPDSGGRQKGVTIVKPIVYGNIAKLLPERLENKHTHEWTAYLRPYKNESMTYIKKVSFKLHESYEARAERVMTTPPFEVRETGWGEFELIIKIFFVDPNERPVTIYHQLKLFQSDPTIKNKGTLVNEHYDEIVFQDPSLMMTQILNNPPKPFIQTLRHEVDFEAKGQKTTAALALAKKKVRAETVVLKDRLRKAIEAKGKLQEQLDKVSA